MEVQSQVRSVLKASEAQEVEVNQILPPKWLLRPIDVNLVTELARSIRHTRLLQPIIIRPRDDAGYEIVCGNHRFCAVKSLGIGMVEAIVCELSDDDAFLMRLSENLLRNTSVDPIQEANGYKMLLERGWTINAIANKIGKSDSYICERLSLVNRLDSHVKSKLSAGILTPSHAELLSKVKNRQRQIEVAELVERKKLSVRTLQHYLDGVPAPRKLEVETEGDFKVIRIPQEFTDAVGIDSERYAHVYVEGRKLIIENIYLSKRWKFTRVNSRVKSQVVSQSLH